ncbi:FHIPEP family type III secretion protein, partial [Planctomycetota bacterium]
SARLPKALLIASAFLAVMGLGTPLPTVPFLIVGAAVGAAGYGIRFTREKAKARAGTAEDGGPGEGAEGEEVAITAHPTPVTLELSPELAPLVQKDGGADMMQKIGMLRRELYETIGMRFPGVRLRAKRPVGENAWLIRIFDIPLFRGAIKIDQGFSNDPPSKFVGLTAEATTDPITGREGSFLDLKDAPRVKQFGSDLKPPDFYVVMQLGVALRRHAADFLGIQETQALLDEAGRGIPALVKEVVPKLVPLTSLTEVMQRLVQEEVSIRDFRAILQSLARWGQVEKDPATLAEYVRSDLKQQISFAFAKANRELAVYLLDPQIESSIRSAIQRTAQGSYLALDPETARKIMGSARKSLGNLPPTASRPIILTAVDVRRYLKKLLELDLPHVVVLSYQEISPLLTVQPVGRISLGR